MPKPKGTKNITSSEAGVDETPNLTVTTTDPAPGPAASPSNQKPKSTTTRKRPATAASQRTIPPLLKAPLEAALIMACHKVYARLLQKRLDEFVVRFSALLEAEGPTPAMSEAWQEALEAHKEVQDTLKDWVDRWASSQ